MRCADLCMAAIDRLSGVLTLMVLGTAALGAHAQKPQPPAGTPTDVRYTAPTVGESNLYPRDPAHDWQAPTLFRGEQSGVNYAINGSVGRILVEVDRDGVPADGQSSVRFKVLLFGRDGKPLATSVFVTIEYSGGRVLLPGARTDDLGPRRQDADRVTPGIQLKVDGGVAMFTLLAPAEAQDVRVRITAGGQEAAGTVSFVPEKRPMVAAGLVEGIVSFRNKAVLSQPRRNDGFEQELDSWVREFSGGRSQAAARAAFYLKGMIAGNVLLTAAYDSDKALRARLLRDVRPDELYPVYGDASLRSFDARSAERLYVRVDRGKSYALYGDFVTGDGFTQMIGQGAVASLKQRSLGQYNRTGTGVRLHHEEGRVVTNLFGSRDTLRQVVEEIASQGSGPYGLRNNEVLEGSEKVEVIVRDRFQPSRIVSVRPLIRLVDYTFEPFSGRILLTNFLPAVDDSLNPTSLRITYEVDQGGSPFWVVGGDAQYRLSERIEVGGSVVTDRNPLAPQDLTSANATIRLAPRTALVVEVAQTATTVNTNPSNQTVSPSMAGRSGEVRGNALRVELAHEDERTDARLFYGRSDPEFNNPGAPMTGGREEIYARGGVKLTDDVKLYAESLSSADRNPGGGQRVSAGMGLRWFAAERLTLDASLRAARETVGDRGIGLLSWPYDQTNGLSGSIASGSGGGALGFGNQVIDLATGMPVIQQGGLPAAPSRLPAGTRLSSDSVRLGAGYRLTDRATVGAEIEQNLSGHERRRVGIGGDYTFAERTRLYGRYEHQDGWVQLGGVSDTARSAGTFAVGVDSAYLKNTQVFSEYRLRDAVSDRDLQLAAGMRNDWDVAPGWRVTTALENLRVISGVTAPVSAASVGVDWSASALWRASTRVEVRRSGDIESSAENERFTTTLWQAMAARKLARDWTLLARNHMLTTRYAARGDVFQDRAQIGLAYRETDRNRVNALGKIEYKIEKDASSPAAGDLSTRAWIASLHADYRPSRPWWVTGRVAGKWQHDVFEGGVPSSFRAQLLSGRLAYDLTEKWDVNLLAAAQFGTHAARQTAYGAEVGYLLRQNLWLSAGFNVSGFSGDADLAGYEYTRRGAYLRLRFKFDENLFKGRDPAVNRSLDR